MKILIPQVITASSFGPETSIPTVDASRGEVEWLPSGNYEVGNRRVDGGAIYECVQANTGSPSNRPSTSPAIWRFFAPTNRMAPFDDYLFTKAIAEGEIVYELIGSFIDGIAIYGMNADELKIEFLDEGDNPIIPEINSPIYEQAYGEWEYLFGNLSKSNHYSVTQIPIRPFVKIKITAKRSIATDLVELGYIAIGNWRYLLFPNSTVSGAEYGATTRVKDYSYVEQNRDGTFTVIEGRKAKDMTVNCVISSDEAPEADSLLTRVAGKTVAIDVSELPKYSHLSTVGKLSGSVEIVDWPTARVQIEIEGNV